MEWVDIASYNTSHEIGNLAAMRKGDSEDSELSITL